MKFVLQQLKQNKEVFLGLLKHVDKDMYLWKQVPEKWCLLEIVCHLYDEEREDFRFRTQWVLEKPNTIPPAINPVGWVTERHYIEQDYNTMLQKFIDERENSIQWIESLKNPAWENAYNHPKVGILTAKHFYDNWLAHDYLHFRQITKLKFDYLNHLSGEDLNYAGIW
ncbi:DinB family protein [Yeosuana sp. MJ-SS3]|uniref:DinB family protein n=1 Tax=Gilvirhabdus luticola TaxID=3079858 RepID=A0ABU3U4T7_9FLAO|nr:DinB family protein [Yeosuana sp. MJ-SS3]MDU8885424.1 DinB family protein [Yeosuana sp. MJ-SS3]